MDCWVYKTNKTRVSQPHSHTGCTLGLVLAWVINQSDCLIRKILPSFSYSALQKHLLLMCNIEFSHISDLSVLRME